VDKDLVTEREVEHLIKPNGWTLDNEGEAAKVNGLTQEKLEAEGVDIREILREYGSAIDERRIVVGHNCSFDMKLMRAELRFAGFLIAICRRAVSAQCGLSRHRWHPGQERSRLQDPKAVRGLRSFWHRTASLSLCPRRRPERAGDPAPFARRRPDAAFKDLTTIGRRNEHRRISFILAAGWPRHRGMRDSDRRFAGPTYRWDRVYRGLQDELRRIGASSISIIISTNQPVRNDGLPYAQQRAISDPGVAVYFMRNKRALVMAQDRFNTSWEHALARYLHRGPAPNGAPRRRHHDGAGIRRIRGAPAAG